MICNLLLKSTSILEKTEIKYIIYIYIFFTVKVFTLQTYSTEQYRKPRMIQTVKTIVSAENFLLLFPLTSGSMKLSPNHFADLAGYYFPFFFFFTLWPLRSSLFSVPLVTQFPYYSSGFHPQDAFSIIVVQATGLCGVALYSFFKILPIWEEQSYFSRSGQIFFQLCLLQNIHVAKNVHPCVLQGRGLEGTPVQCTSGRTETRTWISRPPHRAPPLATLAGMELFSIPDFCLPRCVQVGGQKFQRDVGMGQWGAPPSSSKTLEKALVKSYLLIGPQTNPNHRDVLPLVRFQLGRH